MYAKIVTHVNGDSRPNHLGEESVPKKVLMIEGKRFEYRKYFGPSVQEVVGEISMPFGEVISDVGMEDRGPIEAIGLTAYGADNDVRHYIAVSSNLFILNDAGKTIDILTTELPD
jgi:hypothetical protein